MYVLSDHTSPPKKTGSPMRRKSELPSKYEWKERKGKREWSEASSIEKKKHTRVQWVFQVGKGRKRKRNKLKIPKLAIDETTLWIHFFPFWGYSTRVVHVKYPGTRLLLCVCFFVMKYG